jgi:uncharacterized cupin superfamily protein
MNEREEDSMPEGSAVVRQTVSKAKFKRIDPYGSVAALYESPDRLRVAGAWNFGPGTFDYDLPYDLFLYVIDGSTSVRVDQGTATLSAGEVGYFTAGSKTRWEAAEEIRAVFFCISDDEPIDIYAV